MKLTLIVPLCILMSFSQFCASVVGIESYPPPVAGYQAPATDTVRVSEMSGRGSEAKLENITILHRQDDLVVHPYFYFPGRDAAIVIDDAPELNPTEQLTLAVWFKPDVQCHFNPQKPLLLKSCPTHNDPQYQYGLFLYNPGALRASLVLSSGGKSITCTTYNRPMQLFDGWNHLAATFDGKTAEIYLNGLSFQTIDVSETPIPIDTYPTPLTVGAYANVPRSTEHSFFGHIGEFGIWDKALTAKEIAALVAAKRNAYPLPAQINTEDSDYSRAVNAALSSSEDVWGKEVLATGDPSYDKVKDYLRPLFYSTGKTNREHAPYNVVLGLEDGVRPLIVPTGDGGVVYNNRYGADDALVFSVGVNSKERFGESLDRLGEQYWEDGWLPVFHTSYTTADGAKWRQEVTAMLPPKSGEPLAAMGRFELLDGASSGETLRIALPSGAGVRFRASAGKQEGNAWVWTPTENGKVLFYAFALGNSLPSNVKVDADGYDKAKGAWCAYWQRRIEQDGILFTVPEKRVMDCQRNKIYQNLVTRWRYSVGCAVYDDAPCLQEGSDAVLGLAHYGHTAEARDGIAAFFTRDRGPNAFLHWENAAKMYSSVEYWHYTHDDAFIREHADLFRGFMRDYQQYMATDPHGLLKPAKHCGDLPQVSYCSFHIIPAWRAMRDMSRLLGKLDYEKDAAEFGATAETLRTNLAKVVNESQRRQPDGTLFVPAELLRPERPTYVPICATVLGSYWNLVIPYAFCTDFWQMEGKDMDDILGFMRQHGSFLLGLLRFNYYPTAIGSYTPDGLAGYYTDGMDNVYMAPMLRILTARNETESLLLAFYSYLAHGMTRETFIAGEGDSVGVYPGHFYRSMYGSVSNAQNAVFLQSLRALLIQETYDAQGDPAVLRLMPATPQAWLEDGKTISFKGAPTIFGAVSGNIVSHVNDNQIKAEWTLPTRNAPSAIHWRLRLPDGKKIVSVVIDGKDYARFDSATGVIDLTGLTGAVVVEVVCR